MSYRWSGQGFVVERFFEDEELRIYSDKDYRVDVKMMMSASPYDRLDLLSRTDLYRSISHFIYRKTSVRCKLSRRIIIDGVSYRPEDWIEIDMKDFSFCGRVAVNGRPIKPRDCG